MPCHEESYVFWQVYVNLFSFLKLIINDRYVDISLFTTIMFINKRPIVKIKLKAADLQNIIENHLFTNI